jgi:hypothetical protein
MHWHTGLATATLLATLGAAPSPPQAQPEGLRALDGEWINVEDRTEGRTSEQQGPTARARVTADGMLAGVTLNIALPTPAKATIGDLAWLAGAWVGSRGMTGVTSIEERWSPPLGGTMLAVSRTVSRGRTTAFEYLRIVERDGGLVYIAQPGGRTPTEFVLTAVSATRAVFENPRHDFPQRIVYEVSDDGRLIASIGDMKGGAPQRFEFRREGS